MNPKDDIDFLRAYQNTKEREILLRQLIKQRKLTRTTLVFLFFIIVILIFLQIFTKDSTPVMASTMFVTMVNFGLFVHTDLKIKILLTQQQGTPIE